MPTSGHEDFEHVASEAQADIVILGHTHLPMYVLINGVHLLNPGSVCHKTDFQDSRTCAVLTLPQFSFEVFRVGDGQCIQSHRGVEI